MPVVRVLAQAATEIEEAAAHYDYKRPGLGFQFLSAVHDALVLLGDDFAPLTAISSELTARGVQRLFLKRFPYALVVRRTGHEFVEVVAVAHNARRPGYWRDRLNT
ncbi:MAG: hypothetical protein GKR94_33730 [Gammaproteobacteria bacterium]|nr:hypothetical protein [Gammaproteobacteria bacterium]